MNPFASLLAAEHLKDLLSEAEAERRARLVRSSTPSMPRSALGRALDRVRAVRPVARPTMPAVGHAAEA